MPAAAQRQVDAIYEAGGPLNRANPRLAFDELTAKLKEFGVLPNGEVVVPMRTALNVSGPDVMEAAERSCQIAVEKILQYFDKIGRGAFCYLAGARSGFRNESVKRWQEAWVNFVWECGARLLADINYLLERARCEFQKSQIALPTKAEIEACQPVLSDGQVEKLVEVFKWFLQKLAEKFRIKKSHRKYLDIKDMSFAHDVMSFLTEAPERFRDLAVDFLRELAGARVKVALFSGSGYPAQVLEKRKDLHEERIDPIRRAEGVPSEVRAFRRIGQLEKSGGTFAESPRMRFEDNVSVGTLLPPNASRETLRTMICRSDIVTKGSAVKGQTLGEDQISFDDAFIYDSKVNLKVAAGSDGSRVENIRGARFVNCRLTVEGRVLLGGQFADSVLDFSRCQIGDKAKICECTGQIKDSGLNGAELVAEGYGQSLTVCNSEFNGGKIDIENDRLRMDGNFLFGTEIVVADDAYEERDREARFTACDFSEAKFKNTEALVLVAERSRNCVFTGDQIAKIKAAVSQGDDFARLEALDAGIIGAGIDTMLVVDHEVPAEDGNGRPKFRPRGHVAPPGQREFFGNKGTLMLDLSKGKEGGMPNPEILKIPKILPPVCGRDAEVLPKRRRLLEFLLEKKVDKFDFTLAEWVDAIAEFGQDDFFDLLGLPKSFAAYPLKQLLALPKNVCKARVYDSYGSGKDVDGLMLKGKRRASGQFCSVAIPMDRPIPLEIVKRFDGSNAGRGGEEEEVEIALYSRLLLLKLHMAEALKGVSELVTSVRILLEQGFKWPTIDLEDKNEKCIPIRGVWHPGMLAKVEDRSQIVKNDVELPAREGGMRVLRGPNKVAGKSTLKSAIAMALELAQAGLPGPFDEMKLTPDTMYDGVHYLPNTRATDGDGQSALQERAAQIARAFANLREIADTKDPKRVLFLFDELLMGAAARAKDANVEKNVPVWLARRVKGTVVTQVGITHNAATIQSWRNELGGHQVQILHVADPDARPHKFEPTDECLDSDPSYVFDEFGLSGLAKEEPWHVKG